MNLSEAIRVNTRYTRSINIERDRGSRSIVQAYLPTMRGIDVLNDVAATLEVADHPRAWSLVGPYGCGKSSFALFLHELLGAQANTEKTACNILAAEQPMLARRFEELQPWCQVVLSGSEEPLASRLLKALDDAVTTFWAGKQGRKPDVVKDIQIASQNGHVSNTDILTLIERLQDVLERNGAGGLLILIDEMGKFLEYEARHAGDGVFLLQQLAEKAFHGRKANLLLFVLLHQGFDLYARGMGEKLKNDWAKVQGRFESVSFVESQDQTMRIVAAAFSNALSARQRKTVRIKASRMAQSIARAKGLPAGLDADSAAGIFASCYPLHPISLLALPELCQRFAQNERTLFSYLGSREPHGFQDSLASPDNNGQWILPSRIYDYFVHNQPAVLADPLTHRRWAEVVTAVERTASSAGSESDGKDQASASVMLAKTIGVLNLVSRKEGLRASEPILKQLFDNKSVLTFQEALQPLLDQSIVQYRNFSDEYRVWQGTDFNIDERINEERDKLGDFDLAAALEHRTVTAPILARRHSVRTGALRCFDVTFVDVRSGRLTQTSAADRPRIVFFLSECADDINAFRSAMESAGGNEIWACHKAGADIRAAMADVIALENIERSAQELAADPVASREVRSRLQAAQTNEKETLAGVTSDPTLSDWYWRNNRLAVMDRRSMQHVLSDIMDSIYPETPVIRNELINRERLSSQAAAARNKLFQHMLSHQDKRGLDIKKNPPERSVYRSVLESGHLHVETDAGWTFVAPSADDPLNLRSTWRGIDKILAESEAKPVTLERIQKLLAEPPIGIKRGVFPILFLHYFLIHEFEIALYDDEIYAPELTYEHVERMVRRPDLFSFQRFRIEGVRTDLFDEYSRALFGDVRDSIDVLSLARPLTNFVMGLDDYAQKTRRLSRTTLQVRQAFFLSKSPQKFLFDELPAACGFGDADDLSGFSQTLVTALRELKGAMSALRESMRQALCSSFNLAETISLNDLRSILRGRCHGLDGFTVDVQGLRSFIRRINDQNSTDQAWLEGILLFLGHKSSSKWTDQDRDAAEYRLTEFSKRLLELERLRLHYDAVSKTDPEHEVILVKAISSADGEVDEVVVLNSHIHAAIDNAKQRIESVLTEIHDKDLALALVARLTSDFLARYRQSNLAGSDAKHVIRTTR